MEINKIGYFFILFKMKKRLKEHEHIFLIICMFMIIFFCFVSFGGMYTAINEVEAYDYEKLAEKFKEKNEKINEWTELIEDRLSDEPELVEMLKEHLETEKSNLNEEEERMLVLNGKEDTYRRWIWPIKSIK